LKARGVWNNTLVVYFHDNGAPLGGGGSNYPLRGGKASWNSQQHPSTPLHPATAVLVACHAVRSPHTRRCIARTFIQCLRECLCTPRAKLLTRGYPRTHSVIHAFASPYIHTRIIHAHLHNTYIHTHTTHMHTHIHTFNTHTHIQHTYNTHPRTHTDIIRTYTHACMHCRITAHIATDTDKANNTYGHMHTNTHMHAHTYMYTYPPIHPHA